MKIYELPGVRAEIIRPRVPLKTWLSQQTKKPYALINASLYESRDGTTLPCGTVIEGGKVKVNSGTGYGFGVRKDCDWAFGSPWEYPWDEYITGYTGLVQRGVYVAPSFKDAYVFDGKLNRIGLGEINGVLSVGVADGVDIYTLGRQALQAGFSSYINLDGGGSRFLYVNGTTVYSSSRTPYNAIAFWRDGAKPVLPTGQHWGIDVSNWQGVIDWDKVKAAGVEFAIIKGGEKRTPDKYAERNLSECNRVGIPCGVYWFSRALSAEDAAAEAKLACDLADKYTISMPVCYDWEYASDDTFKAQNGRNTTAAEMIAFATAFLQTVEKRGYWATNYTNKDYLSRGMSALTSRFDTWVASYGSVKPTVCGLWQYGTDKIDGISVDVDVNISYKNYTAHVHKPVASAPADPPQTVPIETPPEGYEQWLKCYEWYISRDKK